MTNQQVTFLDPKVLIEASRPGPRVGLIRHGAAVLFCVVLATAFITVRFPQSGALVNLFSAALMFATVVGLGAFTVLAVRTQREERERLEALEELVQLRRWPEAAGVAQELLSGPTRSVVAHVQGLIFLSMILARYHRFEDAIVVHNYLLDDLRLDDGSRYGIKLGRAMAMLREDHLFDADRAISDLRRSGPAESGGLALVELYRDVKTGHPREALELFGKRIGAIKAQLGHRAGDAYALAAKAFDLLNMGAEAGRAWREATVLVAREELERRYPELAGLAGKYGGEEWNSGAVE